MGELWPDLARTLSRLAVLADDPTALGDRVAWHALRRLQYELHVAGEQLAGLEPPVGAATAHAELAAALEGARDATAEVAEAVALSGVEAVPPLLHEWRGALFRVRLARMRFAAPAEKPPPALDPAPSGLARAVTAFVLALAGALAFLVGATLGLWPLWTAGIVAVAGSIFAYRP